MVVYAKRAGVAKVVGTTSNGSTLTEELCGKIIDCGLDHIRISVVGLDDQSYRDLTVTFGDYEKIRQNVARLYQEKKRRKSRLGTVKTNDTGMTPEQRSRFERDFNDISDMVQIDTLMGWSLSEAKDFMLGRTVSTGMDSISPLRGRVVCPEPFSRLAVNYDGLVSVCCVDWSFGTIVGDLRVESMTDIWNGERLREFRLAHLRGRRDTIPACAQCQYVQAPPGTSSTGASAAGLRARRSRKRSGLIGCRPDAYNLRAREELLAHYSCLRPDRRRSTAA
jgi:MoaA/NifB/PqqE/SkfB family radical SAM enzyme